MFLTVYRGWSSILNQGPWEFDHWFFDRIDREKDRIAPVDLLYTVDRQFPPFLCQKIESLPSLFALCSLIFCKDQRNRFTHDRSFLKIYGIDLITVDLFQRSKGSIRSRSIFFKDRRNQFDHWRSFSMIDEKDRFRQSLKKIEERSSTRATRSFRKIGRKTVKKHTKKKKNLSELLDFWKRFDLYDLFQRSTRAIRSFRSFSKIYKSDSIFSIFFNDRRERFDHGRSF